MRQHAGSGADAFLRLTCWKIAGRGRGGERFVYDVGPNIGTGSDSFRHSAAFIREGARNMHMWDG